MTTHENDDPVDEEAARKRLQDLKADLDKATGGKKGGGSSRRSASGGGNKKAVGKALRLGTELVAGVAVGGLIGYWIDHLAGTKPLWFIVFLLLGIAAGLLNVIRSARQLQEDQARDVKEGRLDMGTDLKDTDDD